MVSKLIMFFSNDFGNIYQKYINSAFNEMGID